MLFLILLVGLAAADPPFLFPHGYFDSNKLKPFDAIYLNLMAASNLEYGGTTLDELDELDAERKQIPRPEEIGRTREEDDAVLDQEPSQSEDNGNKGQLNEGDAILKPAGPKNPFSRIRLNRNLRDDPIEDDNPFEEIATRAPPRSRQQFQLLRNQLRKEKRKLKKPKIRRPQVPNRQQKRERITTSTVPPTLIPSIMPKIRRLPNNPYSALDISQPNIIPLPLPPDFFK